MKKARPLVDNKAPWWAAGDAWLVGDVPLLTIGVVDGAEAFALHYPTISNLLVDSEGFIWAEQWNGDPGEPGTWHVFTKNGVWLGRVIVPPRFRVKAIDRGVIAGVRRDASTGVENVRVYPLRRGSGQERATRARE